MGHSRKRPITGTTPAGVGATYIVVEAAEDDTSIQCTVNGTVTYAVAITKQNILYDDAARSAVNIGNPNDRYVTPVDAVWSNVIPSGAVDALDTLSGQMFFAYRIEISAGTGSVTYHVLQG